MSALTFGAAYTLANPTPDGDFLPSEKPLTPFKAAHALAPNQPSGVFKDAANYWVLATDDEFRALKLQKCVSDYAKAVGLDEYVQQAAAANLNSLKMAIGTNAGFVDVSDIEQHPQWYPVDSAQLPPGTQVDIATEPGIGTMGLPGVPTIAQVVAAGDNPLSLNLPIQGIASNPLQQPLDHLDSLLGSVLGGSFNPAPSTVPNLNNALGTGQPSQSLLDDPELTRMAQEMATQLAQQLSARAGDDTVVKANVSIQKTFPLPGSPTLTQNPIQGSLSSPQAGGEQPAHPFNPQYAVTMQPPTSGPVIPQPTGNPPAAPSVAV